MIAVILLGSRDEALNGILTDPSKFGVEVLFICGLTCFFLMIITFGVNIALPSGLFMPTLLTGSSLGGATGILVQQYFVPSVVPAHFALVGATAVLAGVQRTTVSLVVILMEATGQVTVLIPLIIGVVVARHVGDFFNEGIYEIQMTLKEYPYLEHHIKQSFDVCCVCDIMTAPVTTVRQVETAGYLEELLLRSDMEGFPVVTEDTQEYIGFIRRDQIVALLECSIFIEQNSGREVLSRSLTLANALQKAEKRSATRALVRDDDLYKGKGHSKRTVRMSYDRWLRDNVVHSEKGEHLILGSDDILPDETVRRVTSTTVDFGPTGHLIVRLAVRDQGSFVDIGAAMNRGAYSVVETTPVSKAYALFCSLGLRTLTVLGERGKVVGIISRSNLMPEFMESRTGLRMRHH